MNWKRKVMAGSTLPDATRAAYEAALQSVMASRPASELPARRIDLDSFFESGFPGKVLEDWRYTDLSNLAANGYSLAPDSPAPDVAAWRIEGTLLLVFVNGRFRAEASDAIPKALLRRNSGLIGTEDSRDDGVARLNAALAQDGAVIYLEPGAALATPLHILSITDPGAETAMSHLAHTLELGVGATGTVIFEDATTGDAAHFQTQRVQVRLQDGARLELIRVQGHGLGVQAVSRWDAHLGRDAHLNWVNLDAGGALVRNDLCANLAAPGANLSLSGVCLASGTAHVDNHTRIDHSAPHGTSRQLYRGIATDRARGIFNGKVVVHPHARRSDSDLQIANLLLSPQAEINAKPELQIDNDDVKCAHGSTCGQLDEQALHYLRSRGLPLEAARQILLYAFAHEILRPIRFAPARERLSQRLLARFPGELPVLPPS